MKFFVKIFFYWNNLESKIFFIKLIIYPFRLVEKSLLNIKIFKSKNARDIFSKIYKYNYWGDDNSRSGNGSNLKSTINIRKKLPIIIQKYKIKSILDIPCGDFFWFKKIIKNLNVNYLGGDIVPQVIKINQKYENRTIKFKEFNLIKNTIPKKDLLICRDCLFHFSYRDIKHFFLNFKKSPTKYILLTNHIFKSKKILNKNILTGGFRLLDFHKYPFNFKKNYQEIFLDENYPKTPVKKTMLLYTKKNFISNINFFLKISNEKNL